MKHLYYISVISLLLISCTPPMYIPNTTNVPTLKEKGDLEISYSTGTNGHDLQTAYAITNDWGVMLNGSYGNYKSDSSANFLKHSFIEVGGGRTLFLNKNDTEGAKSMFTLFGGFGYGSTTGLVSFSNFFNANINYNNSIKGDYFRMFLQPSIGLSGKKADFFFTLRTSYVNIVNLETNMEADWNNSYISDDDYNVYLEFLKRKNYNIFVEPTITLKVGGKVKGIMQLGASLGAYRNIETTFRQRPVIALIGLQADLTTKK